ncbi:DUF2637 domain-containing protein [Streptomyces sp. NBC_01571]|uniref:DUF2637 domain-containing protein n=1 Tax=Streptomyces sp. NBC_01571 TaxID=2975883 RepID=UPI00224DF78A|nr:DUF2637 domain-containing protein [Streptomyces sp. NBC_01571]MCX4572317.1 DUF2637 domain-containing protein [Streptomyces sp. NBC_01571]
MNAVRTRLTLAAGLVIVALTAAAFWLSYAHLHDVAAASGLGNSPERAWAWPATLDLFIVAGEIMMLVAALAKRRDPWAIGLTVAGSVGSIGLNVFGVGAHAPLIQYIVAAVPPSAALLAFGALMRQVHHAVAGEEEAQEAPAVNDTAEHRTDLVILEGGPALSPDSGLKEVLDEEDQTEDAPEPDEEETAVFTITTKPTMADIQAAVSDIDREGTPLSGKALASYFGVSDRSGRRYLTDWKAAQEAAA